MNDENNFCKYCLDDITENEQPIIYPCQCSDGVHENCLAIWLIVRSNTNDRYKCEICKTNYIGIIVPPPSPPAPPSPVQLVVPPPHVLPIDHVLQLPHCLFLEVEEVLLVAQEMVVQVVMVGVL